MKTIKSLFKFHINALLLILVYLVLMAPFSLNYIFFMPDERHYVDAAIYMLKNGEYLSPHAPNGGFRFLKPIFTYWAVLASYFTFGVNQFASRLPFLLAAGVSLWMTYKITLLAFNEKKTAILSMVIMGASPVLLRSTAASLTDLFLLVFLQIMIWGVVGLLTNPERRKPFLWAIYIGAGMAVMTKGLPAIAFLLVSLFFLLANPWRRIKLKEMIHLPSLLVGIFLGGFWFVAISIIHGSEALSSFYEDQVGIRVAARLGLIIKNFFISILVVLLILFPLMLPGLRSLFYKESINKVLENNQHKAIFGFSILWILAMIGMASLVSKYYYRYLIPVMPVVAMMFAYFIQKTESKAGIRKMLNASLWIAYLILMLVSLLAITSIYLFDGAIWQIVVVLGLIVISSLLFVKKKTFETNSKASLTYGMMAGIFFILYFLIKPISYPGQGLQITEKLNEHDIKDSETIQFYGKTRIASRIRVASGGEFFFKAFKPFEAPLLPETNIVIFEDTYLDSLALQNFELEKLSNVWRDIDPAEVWKARKAGNLQQLKEKRSESYYLGVRKNKIAILKHTNINQH